MFWAHVWCLPELPSFPEYLGPLLDNLLCVVCGFLHLTSSEGLVPWGCGRLTSGCFLAVAVTPTPNTHTTHTSGSISSNRLKNGTQLPPSKSQRQSGLQPPSHYQRLPSYHIHRGASEGFDFVLRFRLPVSFDQTYLVYLLEELSPYPCIESHTAGVVLSLP